MSHRVVLCTCPPDVAEGIARQVVEGRIAACVNIVPAVQSVYRWEGKMCADAESLLIIKTTSSRVSELTERLLEIHPYDVPEVIALPIESDVGNARYLQWLTAESEG
ncbi:MAG: divalent-cation tolerance protein CutA [Deltaproteobacteria bacterium]|nr:divalent-cation tolerance protein CutA [Deltaproteobacteria bacterium]